MNYEKCSASVPAEITGDPLWKVEAYRLALFAADLAWHDVTKLMGDKRTLDLSGQLYRAAGSIGANVSEGYSRGTGRDRAFVLGQEVVNHRLRLVTHIIRLLLKMIPDQRGSAFQEDAPDYLTDADLADMNTEPSPKELAGLLQNAPLP